MVMMMMKIVFVGRALENISTNDTLASDQLPGEQVTILFSLYKTEFHLI